MRRVGKPKQSNNWYQKQNSIKEDICGALRKEIFVEEGYLVYRQYHALNNDFRWERYFIDDKNLKS